jgi:hypothetical protein
VTDVIASDRAFEEAQTMLLGSLAELMIPAEGDLPSAADAAIFAEIVHRLSECADLVNEGLTLLDSIGARPPGTFSALPPAERLTAVSQLRAECPAFVSLFEAAVAACYYRDERVLRSLGLPARAPYPEGNAVNPTDWSMLDSVRERQPFYRSV